MTPISMRTPLTPHPATAVAEGGILVAGDAAAEAVLLVGVVAAAPAAVAGTAEVVVLVLGVVAAVAARLRR